MEAARSVLEFEDFLFGRDRVALERVVEGLMDLQLGTCFYCGSLVGKRREIDHFIPARTAYLRTPGERLLWFRTTTGEQREELAGHRDALVALLA